MVSFVSFAFISALLFNISFLLLTRGFIISSFPSCFRYAAAKSRQSCPTLCDPIDGSPPGSPVLGILQARILEWVAISSSAWKWKVRVKSLSCVQPLATPWTAAFQAPPSMGFSRQEYWSGVPLPFPRHSKCTSNSEPALGNIMRFRSFSLVSNPFTLLPFKSACRIPLILGSSLV